MSLRIHDGRRLLVQVLVCVNVVIWGTVFVRAEDKRSVTPSKPAEYAEDSFTSCSQKIRVWHFDPKQEAKHPAVVLLYGADGVQSARDLYCSAGRRLASKGYATFLVHYLDATPDDDAMKIGELVKRGLRGTTTAEEAKCVREHFQAWMDCVRDALAYVRKQPRVDGERVGVVGISLGGFVGLACAGREELKLAAAISCFGGLPREMHEQLKSLPPTLVIHGDKDDVVPVEEAHTLRKLAADRKLTVEVKIYPKVGHVFQTAEGQFDFLTLGDAERRMTAHLEKHLRASLQQKEAVEKAARRGD
jgi:dienelactone hydrolase